MSTTSRRIVLAGFTLAAVACAGRARGPDLPGLLAAAEARPRLLATAVVADLEASLARAEQLARLAGLPTPAGSLRDRVVARLGLPGELIDHLDLKQPIALVVVASAPGQDPHVAMSVAATGELVAGRIMARMHDPADGGPGKIWRRKDGQTPRVLRHEAILIIAATPADLRAAGALALDARRAPPEDARVMLDPAAIARAAGTTIDGAFDRAAAALRESTATRRLAPAQLASMEGSLAFLRDIARDTRAIDAALVLDTERGPQLRLVAHPRAGSGFAARLAPRAPFAPAPGFVASAPPAFLISNAPTTFAFEISGEQLRAMDRAGIGGARELLPFVERLQAQLSGAVTARADVEGSHFAIAGAWDTRPGVAPADVIATLESGLSSRAFADLLRAAYGRLDPRVETRREGDSLRVMIAVSDSVPMAADLLRALLGSRQPSILISPGRGRVVLATDPGARTRTGALLAATATPPPPEDLAAALKDARGADGVAYFDLMAFVKVITGAIRSATDGGGLGALGFVPGLLDMRLPLWATYATGDSLAITLRLPAATLSRIGAVAGPFLGAAGGAFSP